ncbi:hypothetical protein Tco_0631466 [Tanacetum coccineum]
MLVRAGRQYLFKNFVLRPSQVVIELVGSFLSQRLEAPVKDMGNALSITWSIGLEVGSIRRIQGVGYGVLKFLGVGTTFDIFQNIHILYLQYGVLSSSRYGVLDFIPLWSLYNGTSLKSRSTEPSDGLAAIQAQLNNLRREIKKANEKVYAAQVRCELCKGPHYTKDCSLKEEGKTLEEAYYTQFGAPYQPGGQYRAVGPGFYQRNNENSSYPERRQTLEE